MVGGGCKSGHSIGATDQRGTEAIASRDITCAI
jgi:hypothetical protein